MTTTLRKNAKYPFIRSALAKKYDKARRVMDTTVCPCCKRAKLLRLPVHQGMKASKKAPPNGGASKLQKVHNYENPAGRQDFLFAALTTA